MNMKSIKSTLKRCLHYLRAAEPLFSLIQVIVVVFGTIFVSCQANTLTRIQLENNRQEHQPSFLINEIIEPNSQGEDHSNSVLYFYSTESAYSDISIDIACFIDFTYKDGSYSYSTRTFNLYGYYFARAWANSQDGKICRIFSEDNHKKFSVAHQEVLDSDVGYIDLRKYVKLSYVDIYGKHHANYYDVNTISQTLLSEKTGSEIFLQYNQNPTELDINDLSLTTLLELTHIS